MAEYIEREAVCTLIKNFGKGAISDGRMELDAVDDIILLASAVECLSAADVVPVVHGRWVKEPPYKSIGGEYLKALICSKCNSFFVSDGNKPWQMHNYCPNCGAKMDGKEQDDELIL